MSQSNYRPQRKHSAKKSHKWKSMTENKQSNKTSTRFLDCSPSLQLKAFTSDSLPRRHDIVSTQTANNAKNANNVKVRLHAYQSYSSNQLKLKTIVKIPTPYYVLYSLSFRWFPESTITTILVYFAQDWHGSACRVYCKGTLPLMVDGRTKSRLDQLWNRFSLRLLRFCTKCGPSNRGLSVHILAKSD